MKVPSCPFCGDDSCELTRYDGWHRCECTACGAHGPVFGDENTSRDERDRLAIEAWKQRF